ncbi:MAG TPA: glycosyl hydrolase family 28 protein [Bryobacteraceae bacterium]|nr:glycosyl hydrolase family 28 protein [Bryobacteraceae bacterium]
MDKPFYSGSTETRAEFATVRPTPRDRLKSADLHSRRHFQGLIASVPFWPLAAKARAAPGRELLITRSGAVADDSTVNTRFIQSAIDQLAAMGGGTVVVPKGVFVSGALFFKPKVHLRLTEGAVLKCSTDLSNFPAQRTRIEGHFMDNFTPAFINAKNCDGFQLTGDGTLDGAGMPIWELFWKNLSENKGFTNTGMPRARLALIEGSKDIRIEGITFKDSQFWNCHLYKNDGVLVHNVHFHVPDNYKQAPSTDGIDIDSSRNVTVDGCVFSVTDDCIACKGSKGPRAMEDKDSPAVEHIRVRNCTFKRGGGVLTCGSEATVVRDVIAEDCRITGGVRIATLKLRPDTPQHYEDITFRNITSEGPSSGIINMAPWSQYFDLQGMEPPKSTVKGLNFVGIKGSFTSFGTIKPNPGQTDISNVLLKDFDVTIKNDTLNTSGVTNLKLENVIVNGKPYSG